MPDTILSLGLAVAFVLPGFIVIELAEGQRSTRTAHSDLKLVLRGLVYALVLQSAVALTGWTGALVSDLGEDGWQQHLGALATFGVVIGVIIPICLGLALSWWLRRIESSDRPIRPWQYALGARDQPDAWDFLFSRQAGTYLLLAVSDGDGVRHFLAKYGPRSWASQAPTRPADLFVEEAWPADAEGTVSEEHLARGPARGIWVSAEKLTRLEVLRVKSGEGENA